MAEIALALAMAFFTIMVLAMISMGMPPEVTPPAADAAAGVALAEAAETVGARAGAHGRRRLIVHHRGRYYDADALTPVDPGVLAGPLTLAVDPALPTAEALALRRRLGAADVIVSTLDERWLNRLKEMDP